VRGSYVFEITPTLYLKAEILSILTNTSSQDSLYYLYSSSYFIKSIVYSSQGLRTEYIYSSDLRETIDLFIFVSKLNTPKITVITNENNDYNKILDFLKDSLIAT